MSAIESEAQPKSIGPDWPIIIWMTIVHSLALVAIPMFSWANLAALVFMHFVTCCLGITLGYHRLLSHRTFKVSKGWERFFATCGALSLQSSPLEWVGHHRMHHAFSDTPKDPHNSRLGFWHAHMGWILKVVPTFDEKANLRKFARDIDRDPYYRFLEDMRVHIVLQIIVGLIFQQIGGWSMTFWAIFLRLVVSYHITWLVNSATHMWGYQNYKDASDNSRNNWIVAILAWGEGWHNNHHRHEHLAPAGHRWWEFDVTYMIIRMLKALGIAYDVNDTIPDRDEVLNAAAAGFSAMPVPESKVD